MTFTHKKIVATFQVIIGLKVRNTSKRYASVPPSWLGHTIVSTGLTSVSSLIDFTKLYIIKLAHTVRQYKYEQLKPTLMFNVCPFQGRVGT